MKSQMSMAGTAYCRVLYVNGLSKKYSSLIKVKLVSSYQHNNAVRLYLTNLM